MKVYITASFKGSYNKEYIENLCSLVKESGFKDFCFIRDIENYQKIFHDANELMQRAKEEIAKCDVLLIDYNGPGHGRMIELGIAYAQNKKIVLITKLDTDVKETVLGVTDELIEYKKLEDVKNPLSDLFAKWK